MTVKVFRIYKAMRNGLNGHSNYQECQNGDLQKKNLSLFTLESQGKKNKTFQGRMDSVQNNQGKMDCWAEEQSAAFLTVGSRTVASNPTCRQCNSNN